MLKTSTRIIQVITSDGTHVSLCVSFISERFIDMVTVPGFNIDSRIALFFGFCH
eukprot:08115.XXX_411943_412104_1 [CDS] Oithona nana genome sequencing.